LRPSALANGAITGWRRVYDWGCSTGRRVRPRLHVGAADDLCRPVAQRSAQLRGAAGYDELLSRRSNRMVFRRGFVPRRGFAITIGNVVSGAGDTSLPRRRKLVTDHEDVHVWQARWLGPFYPVLYGAWMVAGGAIGIVLWAT
jgi:hypothetical protein